MLVLDRVTKTYPNGVRALDGVSASIPHGEIVAIVGGSGCGKSTLLRAIAGLDRASGGQVLLDGEPIVAPHPKVGMVFQEPRLLPWMSAAGNVGFGLDHEPRARRDEKVRRALAAVKLVEKAAAWPRELSGGQAQRAAIARALVTRPEVLLLDEPFSALDFFTRADLQDDLLGVWGETRPTLLIVTHDLDEAVLLADRVFVMRPNPGRLAEDIAVDLPRPRDRTATAFDECKHGIVLALDRAMGRSAQGAEAALVAGDGI